MRQNQDLNDSRPISFIKGLPVKLTYPVRCILFSLLSLFLFTNTSCYVEEEAPEPTSTMQFALTTTSASGITYKLHHVVLQISGPVNHTLESDNADPMEISLNTGPLPIGTYSIHLEDGWVMERIDESGVGGTYVYAELTSRNPQTINLGADQGLTVRWEFEVNGELLETDHNEIDFEIGVDEVGSNIQLNISVLGEGSIEAITDFGVISNPCTDECSFGFDRGATVRLSAEPAQGYRLNSWSGCDSISTDNLECIVTMNESQEVTVDFGLDLNVLDVHVSGHGIITSMPNGIYCGSDCSQLYESGATVTLRASSSTGSIVEWIGCEIITNDNRCIVTMDGSRSVEANFNQDFTLNVRVSGYGMITSTPNGINCGSNCSQSYESGATVVLRASSSTDSLVEWIGCENITNEDRCLVTMDRSRVVAAHFAETTCESTTCEALGSICGSHDDRCGGTIDCGQCMSTPFRNTQNISIPDNDPNGIAEKITVVGMPNCDHTATIDLNILHTWRGDLHVSIVSPNGTKQVLNNKTGGSSDNIMLSGVTLLNSLTQGGVNGQWELRVSDNAYQDTGILQSWTLHLNPQCNQ